MALTNKQRASYGIIVTVASIMAMALVVVGYIIESDSMRYTALFSYCISVCFLGMGMRRDSR